MRGMAALLVTCSFALLIGLRAAHSESPAVCDAYAKDATTAQRHNIRRECNFAGPRWDASYSNHFNWCRGQAKQSVDSERNARLTELTRCTAVNAECRQYASTAVRRFNQQTARCGFFSERFNRNFSGHFKWCRDNSGRGSGDEARARSEYVDQCLGVEGNCHFYAMTAVRQQEENVRRGCERSGPPWNSDYDAHRNWCNSASAAQRRRETQARADSLPNANLCSRDPGRG